MKKKHLYIVAAIIWGIPGVILSIKGINAYLIQASENIWRLLLITAGVLFAFFMISLGITLKHIPGVPSAFTASFYSGLGPMLLLSSLRFMSKLLH